MHLPGENVASTTTTQSKPCMRKPIADWATHASVSHRRRPLSLAGLRTAARISGVSASPNVGLRSTGVRREALGEPRVGRPIPLGLLLGDDNRYLEPGRQRDEPDRAIQRRPRGDGILVREPLLREESGLHVHDHEHRVVSLEQAHAASLRVRLSDGCANREVGALERDVEHVRDPA